MKCKKNLLLVTAFLMLVFSTATFVSAGAIQFTERSVSYYDPSGTAAFAKRLGLKRKASSRFAYYYAGNKLYIGINQNSSSMSKPYVYVHNTGSKKLTFYGAKIGDTKSTFLSKMRNNNTCFWNPLSNSCYGMPYSNVTVKFKNGRLVSWLYRLVPTS